MAFFFPGFQKFEFWVHFGLFWGYFLMTLGVFNPPENPHENCCPFPWIYFYAHSWTDFFELYVLLFYHTYFNFFQQASEFSWSKVFHEGSRQQGYDEQRKMKYFGWNSPDSSWQFTIESSKYKSFRCVTLVNPTPAVHS